MNKCLAELKCDQRGRDFGWLFRNQYVLSRDASHHYPGWNKQHLSGWVLHYGTALPVCLIKDIKGKHVGFLLGHALTAQSEVIRGEFIIPEQCASPSFADIADSHITELSGRYLAILLYEKIERIYCDPVSDLPLLYDAETSMAASSLGLLLERDMKLNTRFSIRNVLKSKQALGLQHSLDEKIKRGVSNHYLDLSDFSLHRHWPPQDMEFETPSKGIPGKIDELTERLQANLAALTQNFQCTMPLTGGQDSRILLSCMLPNIDQLDELSIYRFHNPSRIDSKIAKKIADHLKIPLNIYFKKLFTRTQIRDMLLKMGWSGHRGEFIAIAMIEEYPQDHLVLRGNIMELLRANQWRLGGVDEPFNLRYGIHKVGVAVTRERKEVNIWKPEYMSWYKSLSEHAKPKAYDFAFIEHRLPNYQGAYFNGFHRNTMINPFNDRKIIEIAMGMPTSLRIDGSINKMILERTNPFLLDFPFN